MRLDSTASRVRSSGACSSTSSSKVRFGSSIIAQSSPFTGASTRCASPSSSASPSALASRRAGSMVSTATLRPARGHAERDGRGRGGLAHSARRRRRRTPPSRRASDRSQPSLQHPRQPLELRRADLRLEQVREREHGRADRAPQAGRCERSVRARRSSESAARVAARASTEPRPPSELEPARLLGAEALRGSTPLTTTASSSMPELVAQPLLQIDRLVHRDLLRKRHRQHAGAVGVAHELVDDQRLAADRARPARPPRRWTARAASPARGRWPGRPRSPGRTRRPRCGAPAARGPRSFPSSPAR